MKIYVAGRTTDIDRVKVVASALKRDGHEITFEWWGSGGEIRTDLREEDLLIDIYSPGDVARLAPQTVGLYESDPTVKITHLPTGVFTWATRASKLEAKEAALLALRSKLNAGWRDRPDEARALAEREKQAVRDADAVVLVWMPDILGAALEVGMALAWGTPIVLYRSRRDSVFWYLPGVYEAHDLGELMSTISTLHA